MKCLECGEWESTCKDPRNPPLETSICLCKHCRSWALDEVIEEHKEILEALENS